MKNIHTVLVVDDSKLARLTITRLLKARNLEVFEASSVVEGMRVLRNKRIDAVFMDVMMPEKDGFEGLDLIKGDPKLRHIPCSMYSGDLSTEAQQKAIDSGAQAYLFKPASGENIDQVLRALSSNIIAEDMRKYTEEGEKEESQAEVQRVIAILENRTRNLARVVTQDRKTKNVSDQTTEVKMNNISNQIVDIRTLTERLIKEQAEHKRIESDLLIQLKNARSQLKKVGTLAIVALVIAVVTLTINLFF